MGFKAAGLGFPVGPGISLAPGASNPGPKEPFSVKRERSIYEKLQILEKFG